jgi:hypothetical protein
LANWTPISLTMRRQPRSSTATASADRISYRGIVLTNIATCLVPPAGVALTSQSTGS